MGSQRLQGSPHHLVAPIVHSHMPAPAPCFRGRSVRRSYLVTVLPPDFGGVRQLAGGMSASWRKPAVPLSGRTGAARRNAMNRRRPNRRPGIAKWEYGWGLHSVLKSSVAFELCFLDRTPPPIPLENRECPHGWSPTAGIICLVLKAAMRCVGPIPSQRAIPSRKASQDRARLSRRPQQLSGL
jgi:hypothetical protein